VTERTRLFLQLAPALFLLGGLFLAALGLTLVRSLRYMPALGLTEPDLAAYAAILGSPGFLSALGLSLWIATVSTVIAAVLALGSALLLRQAFPGRGAVGLLFQLNLTVPHVVGAVGILYLFSQSGSFARLAYSAGLIGAPAEFPILTQDPYAIGIILQYVWKEVPFILLPQLAPALTGAAALVFAFAFGAYEIPLILGAHAPEALPVLAWRSFTDVDLTTRPEAYAMAITIALIGAVMLGAYARLALPERARHAG
jgi:putative spermidine/putrescine transport system permease protein